MTTINIKEVKIKGTGTYLPGDPVPTADINRYLGDLPEAPKKIQKWLDSTHDIMIQILGVDYFYYAFDAETREYREDMLDMAVKASRIAIEYAELEPEDIDLLIYGGNYSHQIPPMSTRIQEALGIEFCSEMHIHSNCTSIYKAINVAHDMLKLGRYRNALVVSSNISSSALRRENYNQKKIKKEDLFLRWYLCDGSSAMVLSAEDQRDKGYYLENTYIESPGGKKKACMGFPYPSLYMNPLDVYENCHHHPFQLFQNDLKANFMDQNQESIFFQGLKRMIQKESIDLEKLKYFVINMPTKYVVSHIMNECKEIGIHDDKVYTAISKMGYCGPPAALISLDKLMREEQLDDQDLILSFVTEVSKFLQAGFAVRYCN